MPRNIVHLTLLQLLLIFLGYVALGIVLKLCGYPHDPTVRWTTLAVALREHGLWLMLLPFLWARFALSWDRTMQGPRGRISLLIGIALACVPLLIFIYAAVFPYTRPLMIWRG